ncbi:MAG: Smr/MutS family protein [Crocinitomicaceae bacterium]|nr:Smr/MutS family protein [Crocinitomicaceae bacterium]
MKFQVGQKVVFMHEVGGGIVRSITDKGRFIVEDKDGFTSEYMASSLAAIQSEEYNLDADFEIDKEEAYQTKATHRTIKPRGGSSSYQHDVWEIDLHIEALTDAHRDLSNTEIVRRQLSALTTFFNKARRKSIRKLIIIHGVGEGVLKYEVRNFFDNFDGVKYYDGDYGEYGKGATTVEIEYTH